MKVVVLGAGITGVATAYFLAERGHEVTVIDRNSGPAMETSFANGGQLSYSHAEPWASPHNLKKALKWIWRSDAPLKFRPRLESFMWAWSWQFIKHCNSKSVLEGSDNVLRLALYSREVMQELLEKTPLEFSHLKNGTLHIFKDKKSINSFLKQSEFQAKMGAPFRQFSADECLLKEPALKDIIDNIVGGIFYPMDESGDIYKFCVDLAARSTKLPTPVTYQYGAEIKEIETRGQVISGVRTSKGSFKGERYVMCLGSYSTGFLKKLNIKVPIYPLKGYSISIPFKEGDIVPAVSITDQAEKLVFSRFDNVLRVAGTAEFAGLSKSINKNRIKQLKKVTARQFPHCGDVENASEWSCLRPSTPDGSPIIGRCSCTNLILNTGHGTLGWTLGLGSALIATHYVEGQKPDIDMKGLTIERFC